MGDDIRTRWHEFEAAYQRQHILIPDNSGVLTIRSKRPDFNEESASNAVEAVPSLPNYFLTQSCLELVKSDKCTESLAALRRMGKTELPHDLCIVEFSDNPPGLAQPHRDKVRYFVLVNRRQFKMHESEHMYHPYQCCVFMLYKPDYTGAKFQRMQEMVRSGRALSLWGSKLPETWAVFPQTSVMMGLAAEGFVDSEGTVMTGGDLHSGLIASPWVLDANKVSPSKDSAYDEEATSAAFLAVRALLMLFHVRGVEQSQVSPAKLNKARARRGQGPIPDHTVVTLGYCYNRSGERVKYDPTKPGHKFQAPNIRGPYEQGYWVGPRGDQKLVKKWIEPYLVNYTEGDPLPVRRRKVVRAPSLIRAGIEDGAQL